jgi:hypothetical protein
MQGTDQRNLKTKNAAFASCWLRKFGVLGFCSASDDGLSRDHTFEKSGSMPRDDSDFVLGPVRSLSRLLPVPYVKF